jgi:hypothetical protein
MKFCHPVTTALILLSSPAFGLGIGFEAKKPGCPDRYGSLRRRCRSTDDGESSFFITTVLIPFLILESIKEIKL